MPQKQKGPSLYVCPFWQCHWLPWFHFTAFSAQLASGGPLTVTDPEVKRFL